MATFRIHEDQENSDAALRRSQKENQLNVQQQKRSVLGLISNNVPRIPVTKPSKQDSNVGNNAYGKPKNESEAKKSTFQIYEESQDSQKESKEETNQNMKDLSEAPHRVPFKDVVFTTASDLLHGLPQTPTYSPMVVDKSEKKVKGFRKKEDKFFGFQEYHVEIYRYLLAAEKRRRPKPNYMSKQPDVTLTMRTILVDWLVEVAEEYRLQTETLFLAVSYIDRFLSYMSVVRAKLQLVGTAAMFIAAKYEDVYPPDVSEFVYITDDTYTKRQVLRMEHLILQVLDFDVSIPTILTFISIYVDNMPDPISEDNETSQHERDTILYLAMYLSELSLLEGDPYLQYPQSCRAAAAVALARHTLGMEVWPQELQTSSCYHLADLMPCIQHLRLSFEHAPKNAQQAVREKYTNSRWHNVALTTPRMEPIC